MLVTHVPQTRRAHACLSAPPTSLTPARVQLRCGGVLEAVRISCAGYPSRRQFFDFVDHFWHLAPEFSRSDAADDAVTMQIVTQFLDTGYAKGKTKIFLKGGQMAVLEKHRTNLLNRSAIMIQKHARGLLQGGAYRRLRRTVIRMQARSSPQNRESHSREIRKPDRTKQKPCYSTHYHLPARQIWRDSEISCILELTRVPTVIRLQARPRPAGPPVARCQVLLYLLDNVQ